MSTKRRTPGGVAGGPYSVHTHGDEEQLSTIAGVAQLVYRLAEAGYEVSGRSPHWQVQCPLHEDNEPSLGIDLHKRNDEPCGYRVLIHCRTCGRIGQELSQRFDVPWAEVLHHSSINAGEGETPRSRWWLVNQQFVIWMVQHFRPGNVKAL